MDIDPGRVNSGEGFSGSSAEVAPQKEPLFNRISSPRVVIQSFARFFLFLLCPPFLIAMCVTHSIEDPQNPFFFITFLSHPKEKVKLEVKEKPSDSSSGDGSEDYEDYEDYDGRENETKVISEPEIKAPTQIEMSSSPINAESNGDNNKKNDHEGFLGEILDQEGITPNDTGEIFSLLDFSFLNNFIIETNFPQPSQYFTFEKNVERDDQPVGIIGDTRLYERECGSDGSCLYHSLANQIYNDSGQDREVRQDLFDGIMNLIGCANVDLQKIQEAYEWVKDWRKGNCRDAPGVLAAYEKLVEVKKSESESAKKVDLLKNNKAPEADIEEARAERNSKAAEVKVALGEFCGGIDRKLCSILQIEGFPESVERCPKPAEGDFSFESQSDSHKEISHAAAMILFACQQKRDYVWATSLSAAVLSGYYTVPFVVSENGGFVIYYKNYQETISIEQYSLREDDCGNISIEYNSRSADSEKALLSELISDSHTAPKIPTLIPEGMVYEDDLIEGTGGLRQIKVYNVDGEGNRTPVEEGVLREIIKCHQEERMKAWGKRIVLDKYIGLRFVGHGHWRALLAKGNSATENSPLPEAEEIAQKIVG